MQRKAINQLIEWKNRNKKKPLVITGARQVGKTWLMKEFGKTEYKNFAYINFDSNERMIRLFSSDMDIKRLITGLEIEADSKIIPEETLIIFDEIQECPKALTSLKYFYENAPEYNIVSAGSMLGVALHSGTSFPVGKVEFMELYPISFFEFLKALGENDLLKLIDNLDFELIKTFKDKYINLLRQYYFIGGMPEVVANFVQARDFKEVRAIQKNILMSYEQDFSKHIPHATVPKLRMLWNSIPSQLSKENKKFIYGLIRHGARAREYETALTWLCDCGLVYKINRINKPSLPLIAYEDIGAFKLFISDVGLLSAMTELDVKTLLEGNKIFEEFKGALTEQYVLQQLKTVKDLPVYYWTSDKGDAELDFIIQIDSKIVPIEAKASTNLQAKSLKSYRAKFEPKISVRTSTADYKKEDGLYDIPLYLLETSQKIIQRND
ncbi:MAG: hypothetical protein UR30_C0005G0008 [Candidatus Peregrinibacteria bacterium GW2011_GWC2_33_13]|nr:MAG: hypothetical protein UR30_C0005G0008 [Candidatus Peregrinibacteria bacterium GW2011_GWC2_33_13]